MLGHFLTTTDDYTRALLHEVMPTNYDLVHEPYTVQMPCTFLAFSSKCHNFL